MLLLPVFGGPDSCTLTTNAVGLSTESGIPDYRGSNGSYHRGHKPIIHHEFMQSKNRRTDIINLYEQRISPDYTRRVEAEALLGKVNGRFSFFISKAKPRTQGPF